MASQHVGIYIDDSAVSVLVSRGREPLKWATVSLDPGLVKEGVVQDQNAVAAKIKDIWRNQRILRRRVTFAISGVNCLYQLLLLPELPENLRGEAIAREASQSLGIPLEGVYLSWQVLSVEHGQMKVFLAVVPKDKVDSAVATLRLADLKPVVMDIKPLCLARVSDEARAVIVDTRHDAFDIVVLGEGIPEVVRSLYVVPETPSSERIALLRGELERSVSFYNAAHMDKPIDPTVPILVSGDLAEDEGAKMSLAGPRERPVRVAASPLSDREGFAPAQYAACIGLALKDIVVQEAGAVAYSVVNFNALPESYQVRKRPLAEVLWLPTVLVGVVLVGMGIWGIVYLRGENSSLSADLNEINRRAEEQRVRDGDITALEGQVSSVEAPEKALSTLLGTLEEGRDVLADDLAMVREKEVSTGVSVTSIDVGFENDVKGVVVRGVANSEVEVFNFAWALNDCGRFQCTWPIETSLDESGVSFTINLV